MQFLLDIERLGLALEPDRHHINTHNYSCQIFRVLSLGVCCLHAVSKTRLWRQSFSKNVALNRSYLQMNPHIVLSETSLETKICCPIARESRNLSDWHSRCLVGTNWIWLNSTLVERELKTWWMVGPWLMTDRPIFSRVCDPDRQGKGGWPREMAPTSRPRKLPPAFLRSFE